ncbi:MAG: hypothetical protein QOI34_1319, partial [Verrucomicrobiota bacterium]
MFLFALLALAALVVSIVTASQLGPLRATVAELKRRLSEIEKGKVAVEPPPPPPTAVPPPLPTLFPTIQPPAMAKAVVPPSARHLPPPTINWESFVGVKLFAWIGGLAFFLGVVFFVKYAFENNFITPRMRVLAGALVGIALIVAGILPTLRRYRVPAQSLCATGILILYANIYAAESFYSLMPLGAASILMWIVTGIALILATKLDAPGVLILGVVGGFVTPLLLGTKYSNAVVLFGYVGVLNSGIAFISALKRWGYPVVLAAVGSVILELVWATGFFGPVETNTMRIILLAIQAQFLVTSIVFARARLEGTSTIAAAAIAGFLPLFFCFHLPWLNDQSWDFIFPILLLSDAGLIGLAIVHRASTTKSKMLAVIVGAALVLTWLAEWVWQTSVFASAGLNDPPLVVVPWMNYVVAWHVALLLLFAVAPYFCGTDRLWPWTIAAIAAPLQFWLVYRLVEPSFPEDWHWLIPIFFALPAAAGVAYLVKKQHVQLASGDSRLAAQGAAVLALFSFVFPVQFQREWITLGWAIEGVALIFLFHWIPNRRLRFVALIILSVAFVRLALNPAVIRYHPRSRTPIFNWYLYAYGLAAICFIAGARWFGAPREKEYERKAAAFLYILGGIVLFLLLNIEIADYFSIGPTLTFSFAGNFA